MNRIGVLVNRIIKVLDTVNKSIYNLLEDEELHIILQKAYKADVWTCVFKGHDKINPII